MWFDREALKGIFYTLTGEEMATLESIIRVKHGWTGGLVPDDLLKVIQDEMVALGYIMPFEPSPVHQLANEYEEIMSAQEVWESGCLQS